MSQCLQCHMCSYAHRHSDADTALPAQSAECGRVLLSSGSAVALSVGSAAVGVSRAPQVNEPMNEHVDKLTTESELCHYMCARRTDTPKATRVPWEGSCHTPNTRKDGLAALGVSPTQHRPTRCILAGNELWGLPPSPPANSRWRPHRLLQTEWV